VHSHHTDEGAPSAAASEIEPETLDAARAVIAQDEQRRMEACAAEIQAVLAKYGMQLDVPAPRISIVPLS
jgi:hypothetical protein